MPINILATLLAVVIALAAMTVGGMMLVFGSPVHMTTWAVISVVALLGSIIVHRALTRDN